MTVNAVGILPANTGTNAHSVRERIRWQSALIGMQMLVRVKSKGTFFPKVCTLVRLEKMRPWLDSYPNKKACFLIEGFANGFPLPTFLGEGCKVVGNFKVCGSVSPPQVVRDKLCKELAEGRFCYVPSTRGLLGCC